MQKREKAQPINALSSAGLYAKLDFDSCFHNLSFLQNLGAKLTLSKMFSVKCKQTNANPAEHPHFTYRNISSIVSQEFAAKEPK